ncbi:MAG: RDD family protein [Flavobacterium sp.]|nr:RDD family protein [Flavobacterium sp.]
MNTDFKGVMSNRTDEDLIKIVTVDRDGYQPLAIEAAEQEIKNRNIDTTKIEQVKADLRTKTEEQKEFASKKVSSLTRFIHFIVDTIAFVILTMVFAFVLGLFINATDQSLMTLMGYLMLAAGFFGYYVFMETKFQKTIGKFITKTKVVNKNGTRPEVGDIVRRTFCRLIPFDRVSFLFTPNGFHDRLSDTTIIKDEN